MTIAAALNQTILGTGPKQWGLWLATFVAAIALTVLALFSIYPPGDVTLTRAVQAVQLPGLDLISDFIFRVGLSPTFQLIALTIAAVMALRRQHLAALFVVLAAIARGSVVLLKELVERPRPSPFQVDVTEQAGGVSFPSGHVLGAVLLWGLVYFASEQLIANRRIRRWVQWSSLALIVLTGFQRVWAGAHWPSDVLAAYLWGGVILFAVVQVYRFCAGCHWRSLLARIGGRS